jgi:hypothetical protein
MRRRAWSPGFSPPAHSCGSSAQGFLLLRVRLTPCKTHRPLFVLFTACPGLPGYAARSPSITLEDFPSVPTIQTLPGLLLAIGLVLLRGLTHRTRPLWFTVRSGQRFGFRPSVPHLTVTHCLSPTASRQWAQSGLKPYSPPGCEAYVAAVFRPPSTRY